MKVMIGLETHVQLNTKSKIFCGCANPVNIDGRTETEHCDVPHVPGHAGLQA